MKCPVWLAVVMLFACAANTTPATETPSLQTASQTPSLPPTLCPAQSPINIVSSRLDTGATKHVVKLHYETAQETIANLGHTVQVDFAPGSTVEFDGNTYAFRQFHFHTPSEHQVDGKPRAMEMHMVHTLEGDENTYLVIGVFFEAGESSGFLEQFIDALPQMEGERVVEPAGAIDVTTFLATDEPFFHYNGSLTTPPYTETVTWLVSESTRTATAAQIERFASIEGNNARAVQALAGRVVDEI